MTKQKTNNSQKMKTGGSFCPLPLPFPGNCFLAFWEFCQRYLIFNARTGDYMHGFKINQWDVTKHHPAPCCLSSLHLLELAPHQHRAVPPFQEQDGFCFRVAAGSAMRTSCHSSSVALKNTALLGWRRSSVGGALA